MKVLFQNKRNLGEYSFKRKRKIIGKFDADWSRFAVILKCPDPKAQNRYACCSGSVKDTETIFPNFNLKMET